MKFLIQGKEYDAEAGVAKATLTTLYELKLRHGIGMKSLIEMTQKFSEFESPLDVLEDRNTLQAFRVIIWLARKHAGEKLSLDEANDFPLNEMQMVVEDEEQTSEPDPKATADSVADDGTDPDQTAPVT